MNAVSRRTPPLVPALIIAALVIAAVVLGLRGSDGPVQPAAPGEAPREPRRTASADRWTLDGPFGATAPRAEAPAGLPGVAGQAAPAEAGVVTHPGEPLKLPKPWEKGGQAMRRAVQVLWPKLDGCQRELKKDVKPGTTVSIEFQLSPSAAGAMASDAKIVSGSSGSADLDACLLSHLEAAEIADASVEESMTIRFPYAFGATPGQAAAIAGEPRDLRPTRAAPRAKAPMLTRP